MPPAGFEPARMPPEGTALSPELRGPGVGRPYQRHEVDLKPSGERCLRSGLGVGALGSAR